MAQPYSAAKLPKQTSNLQSQPERSAAKSSRFYRPELDVLRFLAFLLVYFHHVLPALPRPGRMYHVLFSIRNAGASGVCLFFLLSSYLITELLLREQDATGTIHIQSFYVRRVLRIWPLYFFMLFAGYIFGQVNHLYAFSNGRLLAFLLLAGNWYTSFFGYTTNFISPLWSISLEEQFYLLWPTIARLGRRTGILIASLIFWVGAYVALALLCRQKANLDYTVWANSFVQFQYFALGGLIALMLKGKSLRIPTAARWLCLLSGVLVFFLSDFVFHAKDATVLASISQTLPGYLLIGIGCLLLFFGMLGAHISRAAQPLVYLGKISYGLYVFHVISVRLVFTLLVALGVHKLILQVLIAAPIGLAITIGLATLSYRYLESPFLKLKERFSFVRSRGV